MYNLKIKFVAVLLSFLMTLSIAGCSGGLKSLDITVESPKEEVDIVAPEIRAYMDLAKNYVEGDYSSSVKVTDNLGNMPVPVVFNWYFNDKIEFQDANIIISKNEDLSDPIKVKINKIRDVSKKQSIKVYNLETGAKYYWCIEAITGNKKAIKSNTFSFETMSGPRILNIENVKNARDLGTWKTLDGKTIKQGVIFRTAKLNDTTADGENVLLNDLKIKTELDLRNSANEEIYSPISDRVFYYNIAGKQNAAFWNDVFTEEKVFRIFTIPDNYPILIHCLGGADRTGALSYALNALCGVSETDLIMDYELTNKRFRMGSTDGTHVYDFPTFVNTLKGLNGDTLQDKVYNFLLNNCGLSEMEIYNIKTLMTSDCAVFKEPPRSPETIKEGKAQFKIDARKSGEIVKIRSEGNEYDFSFKDGILTVITNDTSKASAIAVFKDGTEMPLAWTK